VKSRTLIPRSTPSFGLLIAPCPLAAKPPRPFPGDR
jgi:hypothetical protein